MRIMPEMPVNSTQISGFADARPAARQCSRLKVALHLLWLHWHAGRAVALGRPVFLLPFCRRHVAGMLLAPDGERLALVDAGGLDDLPYGAFGAAGSWWLLLPAGDRRLARRWRLAMSGRVRAVRPVVMRRHNGLILVRMEIPDE
jgi:hypothetical protein